MDGCSNNRRKKRRSCAYYTTRILLCQIPRFSNSRHEKCYPQTARIWLMRKRCAGFWMGAKNPNANID